MSCDTIQALRHPKKQNEGLLLHSLGGKEKGREVGYILSLRISLRGRAAQRQVTASASQLVTIHALLSQRKRGRVLLVGRDRERVNEGVIAVKHCVCVRTIPIK